ncbi:MAG: acetyl-CoA carboxylase carboxyl transferase subunit alpha, partial [Desulfuromonadales bacterium]|nr:acetyl-CoA carboxylase carboxyl transferase subunit alpha [Desulfuromonadales bacterium]
MNQYLDFEQPIADLETKIGELRNYSTESVDFSSEIQKLEKKADKLKNEV